MTGTKNATEDVHVEFPEFAPSAIPVINTPIVGKFQKLLRGPENKYGTPLILEFEAEAGAASPYVDGDVVPLIPGKTYALWLLHEALVNSFKEARPKAGERFGVKYLGSKVKKDVLKAGGDGTGDNETYHGYAFVMPDRPVIEDTVEWDDI